MNNKQRLKVVYALLNEMSLYWNEADVVIYPKGLPSFDELVCLIGQIGFLGIPDIIKEDYESKG